MVTITKPVELPWAYAKRKGFSGTAPGLYFQYFRTRAEAERSAALNKRWHGPIEYRPGECRHIGYI
jgi:hypothetical protein